MARWDFTARWTFPARRKGRRQQLPEPVGEQPRRVLQLARQARGQRALHGRDGRPVLEPRGNGGGEAAYVPPGEREPVIGTAQGRGQGDGGGVVLVGGRFRGRGRGLLRGGRLGLDGGRRSVITRLRGLGGRGLRSGCLRMGPGALCA
ncbi:hypothetical protein RM550_25360 [Streptomyces sp. DSM 41527]|uniref:Uncharacterized protein n=1 Tax=Streptomyces mooreae TaxID=3075523 RepID=A0ABU2TDK9_9ACTN|nr:hypothetical protein [Streptomyces sp. DSM 41527]MDT0459002.1 hypothetical protein [Streptomyces sp. DSM 41527]